jgi:hypothetical protein
MSTLGRWLIEVDLRGQVEIDKKAGVVTLSLFLSFELLQESNQVYGSKDEAMW